MSRKSKVLTDQQLEETIVGVLLGEESAPVFEIVQSSWPNNADSVAIIRGQKSHGMLSPIPSTGISKGSDWNGWLKKEKTRRIGYKKGSPENFSDYLSTFSSSTSSTSYMSISSSSSSGPLISSGSSLLSYEDSSSSSS
jgi:hypothetical protein